MIFPISLFKYGSFSPVSFLIKIDKPRDDYVNSFTVADAYVASIRLFNAFEADEQSSRR